MSDLTTRNGLSYGHLAWSALNSSSSLSSSAERASNPSGASLAKFSGNDALPADHDAASDVAHLDAAAFPAVWDYPWLSPDAVKLAREARRSIESSRLVVGLIAQRECALHAQSARNMSHLSNGVGAEASGPVSPRYESRIVADRLQRTLHDVGHRVAEFVGAMWRDMGAHSQSFIAWEDAQAAPSFANPAPQAEAPRTFAADVAWLHSSLQSLQEQASAIVPWKRLEDPCKPVLRTLEVVGVQSAQVGPVVQGDARAAGGDLTQSTQPMRGGFVCQANQAVSGSHSAIASSASAAPLLAMSRFV